MAVSVKITMRETSKLQKKLRKLSKGTGDFSTPLKQSGIQMEKNIGVRFKNAQWKPLSNATKKIRPDRIGGKPLNDTGKLKMSVTSRATKHVTKRKLEYGTNLIYAPMHNFGGVGGWGYKIPQREFLYFDDKDERQIRKIFEDYVKELSN
jgi:phage gpG-like protein